MKDHIQHVRSMEDLKSPEINLGEIHVDINLNSLALKKFGQMVACHYSSLSFLCQISSHRISSLDFSSFQTRLPELLDILMTFRQKIF